MIAEPLAVTLLVAEVLESLGVSYRFLRLKTRRFSGGMKTALPQAENRLGLHDKNVCSAM